MVFVLRSANRQQRSAHSLASHCLPPASEASAPVQCTPVFSPKSGKMLAREIFGQQVEKGIFRSETRAVLAKCQTRTDADLRGDDKFKLDDRTLQQSSMPM